jgi:putative FmdB family regulatory protein
VAGSQRPSRYVIKSHMPIYEYSCRKCGTVIEKIQKFSDPPLKRHAGCGGALTKLVSQSAFHLKGSGWYVTDYARKGTPESEKDSKTEGKTESSASSSGTAEETSPKKTDSTSKRTSKKGSEVGAKKR